MSASKVIDIRSDTVTKPTKEMREAMMAAVVDDDVYGDDPTVKELQEKMATLLNKESGLFFPSGTMSNLAGIMAHASARGDEVLLGDRSHIALYEQGSISSLGGVFARQLKNFSDGTFDLEEMKSKIHLGGRDGHLCHTRAVVIENTHNYCCGTPVTLDFTKKVSKIAKEYGLKLHIDGARVFNAATALGVPVSEVVKEADSVSVCLSKGLGAPVGTVLVGSKDFIDRCHRIRKSLGGGMRQVGILAAAGIVALDTIAPRLSTDHENAKYFAGGLSNLSDYGLSIDVSTVKSNMVMFSLERNDLSAERFCEILGNPINASAPVIKACPKTEKIIRFVTHHQVTREDIDLMLETMEDVLKQKY